MTRKELKKELRFIVNAIIWAAGLGFLLFLFWYSTVYGECKTNHVKTTDYEYCKEYHVK